MTTSLTQFTRLIDEAFNGGNLTVLDELVSPDFVEHQFESPQHPARITGPDGVARIITELRRGADDFHLAIEDVSVTDNTVWARLRGTGKDTGGQLGQPPTGRPFQITVIDVARFLDHRMIEHWGVPDRLGLLLQLGLFQRPPRDTRRAQAPRSRAVDHSGAAPPSEVKMGSPPTNPRPDPPSSARPVTSQNMRLFAAKRLAPFTPLSHLLPEDVCRSPVPSS